MSRWRDAARLAVGTLSAVPVTPPTRTDRAVAGRAMLLAPAVGLGLGAAAASAMLLARWLFDDALLAAVVAVVVLAALTRALHLDGLADTADGLGASSRGPAYALDVMRRGDVGPFGVIAVVLVLLVQVAALAAAVRHDQGTVAVVVAVVAGRLAAVWSCGPRQRPARRDGLGASVVGTVPASGLWVTTALVVALAALAGGVLDDDARWQLAALAVGAVVAGLAVGWLVRRVCRRAFGGVTGDVLGAVVELSTAASLLVLAL